VLLKWYFGNLLLFVFEEMATYYLCDEAG